MSTADNWHDTSNKWTDDLLPDEAVSFGQLYAEQEIVAAYETDDPLSYLRTSEQMHYRYAEGFTSDGKWVRSVWAISVARFVRQGRLQYQEDKRERAESA